ncbi:hypothetical protein D3C83_40560 [compost metagenome]
MVQAVMLAAQPVQRFVIVRIARLFCCGLELAHLRLDQALLGGHSGMMLVRLDAKGLAQRRQQVLLVELRVTLHCLMLERAGDFA